MFFIIEIISWGIEVVKHAQNAISETIVFNEGLLLLLLLKDIPNNEENKVMINKFYEELPELKNIPQIQEVVSFICEDNFKDETYNIGSNLEFWPILKQLKKQMFKYYTKNFCEKNEGAPFYQFHTEFNQMILKMKKLRIVIEPEFHIIKNVHPTSKIPYFSVRGFWLDENGKKVKIFTKSLGREDKYIDGKNDESLLEEARVQIQQLASLKYKEEFN